MTIAAIWYEKSDNCVWATADTRISADGQHGGTVVRTDTGAKLFPLQMFCHRLSSDPTYRRQKHYFKTLGFAFAGAVVPAMMTHATAGAFLQNLAVQVEYSANPPRLDLVAEMIRRMGEQFSKDYLSSTAGEFGAFEAALFGWCPYSEQYVCFHMQPSATPSSFELKTSKVNLNEGAIIRLGTGAGRFDEHMGQLERDGDHWERRTRLPKVAIERMIAENASDVGGSLSIGRSEREDFRLYGWVSPVERGKPEAQLAFNGIELNNQNIWVDQYLIAIDSIV